MTAALFGAGLFVFHRWSLPTTGYALLMVSVLLVPLNLLAFAAFSLRDPVGGGWTVAVELLAVVVFGWLTWLAGRVVIPDAPALFAGGLVGLSACSLITGPVTPLTDSTLLLASLLPVTGYLILGAISLWRHVRNPTLQGADAKRLLVQLGVQTFACLAPLGLLLYESGNVARALHLVAPVICAFAGPALLTGLFLWHRSAGSVSAELHTTALGVALMSAAVMLLGVGLAWPEPSRLLPSVMLNALAMIGISRITRHPLMHATAAAWFALAWVLVIQLACGGVSWSAGNSAAVLGALASATTGNALVGPAAACALIAAWLHRRQRRVLSLGYGVTALAFALISLALVTVFGFAVAGDPRHVTWVYAVYAALAFAAARPLLSPIATWGGGLLAQMAIVQVLAYLWPVPQFAWPTALLVGAGLCVAAVLALKQSKARRNVEQLYLTPLTSFAVSVSLMAAVWMTIVLSAEAYIAFSVRMTFVSALWLVIAFMNRSSPLFAGSQAALAGAVCIGVQHQLCSTPWYGALSSPLREPWVWQAHLMAVGGLSMIWAAARALVDRRCVRNPSKSDESDLLALSNRGWSEFARNLMNPAIPTTDQWMAGVVLLGLAFLSAWSVWPGVVAEHGWLASWASLSEHVHAAGIGSWILLVMVIALCALRFLQRDWRIPGLGVLAATACGLALLAAKYESQHQVVSAWCWLSAFLYLVTSAAVWMRDYWLTRSFAIQRLRSDELALHISDLRLSLFVLFALPALLLTATFDFAVGSGTSLLPPALSDVWLRLSLLGPALIVAACLFGHGVRERQPAYAAAAGLLTGAIVSGTELGMAGRAGLVLSSTFVVWLVQVNAIASGVAAILWSEIHRPGERLKEPAAYPAWPLLAARAVMGIVFLLIVAGFWIQPQFVSDPAAQAGTLWGALAVALVEWALFLLGRRRRDAAAEPQSGVWVYFGVALLACAVAPFDTGNWLCFHTLLVGLMAAGWLRLYIGMRHVRRLLGSGWQETYNTASAQSARRLDQIDHDLSCTGCTYNLRGLSPFHRCPECNASIADSIEAVVARLTPQWSGQLAQARGQTAVAILVSAVASTLFALRAAFDGPQSPWWSVAVLAALSAQGLAFAGWAPRRVFAYLGGIELCLSAGVWWIRQHWLDGTGAFEANLSNLANANVVALAIAGTAWFFVERTILRRRSCAANDGRWPAFHHTAAVVSAATVAVLAGLALYAAVIHQPLAGATLMSWLGWSVATAFMGVCITDTAFRRGPAGLYALGLAGLVLIVVHACTLPLELALGMSIGLAVYVLITAWVWRHWAKPGFDSSTQSTENSWLFSANVFLVTMSVALGVYVSLTHPEMPERLLVSLSPLLCAASAMVAAVGGRKTAMQTAALVLIATGGVLFAWSWVPPDAPTGVFLRVVGLFAAISAMTIACSVATRRIALGDTWLSALGRSVLGTNTLAGAALLYCSGYEIRALVYHQDLQLTPWAAGALSVSLVAMVVSCVLFATRQRLDPLRLAANSKGVYIYLAECLAAALVLHVRVMAPWLFSGVLMQYWPMIIMALAFAAVAAGEALERQVRGVLARPLGRTGIFLPALALLDFFVASSQVHYSITLLTAGALYAVLAGLRRSAGIGVLAALALNGSLWYLLQHTPGLGIARHPQLWFIPPALAALTAGHLNRARLREEQRRSLHYGCLLVIYLSSTADIFLIGVAMAPWLPLVLAGLSIAGILIAFASRIRSFLWLGTGFLCLSMLTMVWHAAENLGWTWAWYVSGIAVGLAMITLFAFFEKKRREMSAWLENLRGWSS